MATRIRMKEIGLVESVSCRFGEAEIMIEHHSFHAYQVISIYDYPEVFKRT